MFLVTILCHFWSKNSASSYLTMPNKLYKIKWFKEMYILSEINEGLCFVTEGFQVENEQFSNSIVRVPLL